MWQRMQKVRHSFTFRYRPQHQDSRFLDDPVWVKEQPL